MQFIDKVKIRLKAGNGGDGIVAFKREKYNPLGGPSGGDGGKGGSIIFKADSNKSTLLDLKYSKLIKAENGDNGKTNNMYGESKEDVIIRVPVGTIIKDLKDALEKDHSIAIAGPRIYTPDGEFEALTMVKKKRAVDTLRLMALETPLRSLLGWFEKKQIIKEEINKLTKVYAVAGSCFMISGYNIDMVYPLDEHTFFA